MKNQIIYKSILLQAGCLWTNPYLRCGTCFPIWRWLSTYHRRDWGHEFVFTSTLPLHIKGSIRHVSIKYVSKAFGWWVHWQLCLWELVLPVSLTLACEYQGLEGWDHEQGSKDTLWDFTVLTGNELRHKSGRERVWDFASDANAHLDTC